MLTTMPLCRPPSVTVCSLHTARFSISPWTQTLITHSLLSLSNAPCPAPLQSSPTDNTCYLQLIGFTHPLFWARLFLCCKYDFPALFSRLISCCHSCLSLTSASRQSCGKASAFCPLNTSSVFFTCVCSLSLAVWCLATLTSLLKFCELKISMKLRKSEALAYVLPVVVVVVKRSFWPAEEDQSLSELIKLRPRKEFKLTCTRRSCTQSLPLPPTPKSEDRRWHLLCSFSLPCLLQ